MGIKGMSFFKGRVFLKRVIILACAVFLGWSVSTAYSDNLPMEIAYQQTMGEPDPFSGLMAQMDGGMQQPQPIMPQGPQPTPIMPQQTMPTPQAQPQTQPPPTIVPQPQGQPQAPTGKTSTRIQRLQQVQEQIQKLQQAGHIANNAPVENVAPGGVTQPPQPVASGRTGARAGGMISLNFDDADVYSVVQTVFGEILRVNYVVDQRVKGRVTFRSVAPVAVDQVLPLMEVILRLNGMGVVEEGGLYRIVPIGDVAKEPAQVMIGRDPNKIVVQGKSIIQVVPISYSSSSEMVKLITPFLTTTAIVIDVPNMNHIILVDTDANVKRILNILSFFDSEETKMKKPQVYVYHIQNSKAKDVAAILQQIFSTSSVIMPASTITTTTTTTAGTSGSSPPGGMPTPQPARPATSLSGPQTGASSGSNTGGSSLISSATKIIPDENLNLLVVLALPEDYEIIKEAVKSIDIIPRQVVLEGVIAEVNLVDDLSLGISWALQFKPDGMNGVLSAVQGVVGFNSPGATPVTTTTTTSSGTTTTTSTGAGTFSFAGVVGSDFKAVIDMLATQSKAKLLAVPHILVSDNKEARIQVGEQVPIVTSETFGSGTVAPQRTIQYKDIGIILKVKPRINEGGLVSLDISQEISSYSVKKVTATDEGIIVNKTEATTNLVVQGGQTIIIGGLIREDVSDGRAGIPLLGKIPVLGYLFGRTDKTNHRKELIILLTPRVIKNQADAQAVTSGYVGTITETGKGKITKEELLRNQKTNVPVSPLGNNTTNINLRNNGGEENNLERKD